MENKESIERIRGTEETKLYISAISVYSGDYECIDSYEENGVYFYTIRMDADMYLNAHAQSLKPIFDKDDLALRPENMFYYCYNFNNPVQAYMEQLGEDLSLGMGGY